MKSIFPCIEMYFFIQASKLLLQILGFSWVEQYDSWIANKPFYPINLSARRKGAKYPELLVLEIGEFDFLHDNICQGNFITRKMKLRIIESVILLIHLGYSS